jgi:hypothetical protein
VTPLNEDLNCVGKAEEDLSITLSSPGCLSSIGLSPHLASFWSLRFIRNFNLSVSILKDIFELSRMKNNEKSNGDIQIRRLRFIYIPIFLETCPAGSSPAALDRCVISYIRN